MTEHYSHVEDAEKRRAAEGVLRLVTEAKPEKVTTEVTTGAEPNETAGEASASNRP